MICPKCGAEMERDEVDNGVGLEPTSPWGCPACHYVDGVTEDDYTPGTIVTTGQLKPGEVADLVRETWAKPGTDELLQRYNELWYNSGHTWTTTQFLGVGMMKSPNDLWVYQDIISVHRPTVIFETGTWLGGSSLWFAFLCDALGIPVKIITCDYKDQRRIEHPNVSFVKGRSTDPGVVAEMVRQAHAWERELFDRCEKDIADAEAFWATPNAARPVNAAELIAQMAFSPRRLVSLDADHTEAHVYAELNLFAPLVAVGDWLVVEDTNISWPAVDDLKFPGDGGARAGAERFLREHNGEFRQDAQCERYLLTMHPGGWWQREQAPKV